VTLYLLDTNIASHVIKGDIPVVRERLVAIPISQVAISSVTHGELMYGLAKRGWPAGLTARVHEFLIRVDTLPWDRQTATAYGKMRAACEASGIILSPLDLMIAAHASALDAILVTRDKAFSRIPDGLVVENWIDGNG